MIAGPVEAATGRGNDAPESARCILERLTYHLSNRLLEGIHDRIGSDY
jgi:hypothetical protein